MELFEPYKNLPELWKEKSDIFKDRNKKKIVWAKLLEIYKQIEKDANIDSLKKRVNNIRTCFRRELKKSEDSQRSGGGAEDVYVPNLWYFDELEFLRDHETRLREISTIDLDEEIEKGEEALENLSVLSINLNKKMKNSAQQIAERTELLKDALGHFKTKQERTMQVYTTKTGLLLPKIFSNSTDLCKKAIEEILVLGQLVLLTLDTVKTPSNSSTPCTSTHTSTSSTPRSLQSPPSSYTPRTSTPIYHSSLPSQKIEHTFTIPIETYNSVSDLFNDNSYST